MEVHYKFKSAKDFTSIPIDWHYTTVSDVIQYIFTKKCSGKRSNSTNFDNLFLTNAQTNQEYLDGETLIPSNTSLIVRRAPNRSFLPIVITPSVVDREDNNLLVRNKLKKDVDVNKNIIDAPSVSMDPQESEWEEFWNYLSPPKIVVPVQDASPSTADEDSKIRALINTPALDWWQCHNTTLSSSGAGRGFGRGGIGGRTGGRDFGRGGLLQHMLPPSTYICRRCKVPGHFIQHCPTNGDPAFDIKRTKPPTGIPHSMLMAAPDGSYALPNGDVAVLKPNEAAFEKEILGMIPSTCSVADLPAELYCSLCKAVMKDAVFASKCCFKSFCDKCIRDYIISNKMCICGATKVLADDLLPNRTLRDTIIRFLESSNCRGANVGGGVSQSHVTESSRILQVKIPSSTSSTASEGVVLAPKSEGSAKVEEMAEPVKVDIVTPKTQGEATVRSGSEVSEAADGCSREPESRMCSQVTDEEMKQKPVSGDVRKKKKKCVDMQSRPHQDFAAENYLMPWETSYHSPYWNSMQPKFDGFGRPYGAQVPFMGYGLGPTSIPFGGAVHQDFFGAQAYVMPMPPQNDLAKFGMGFIGVGGPSIMSRESEVPKTTIKQKQDLERSGGNMEVSKDGNSSRGMIGKQDVPSVKSEFVSTPPERSPHDPELIHTSSKTKVKHDDDSYEEHTHQPLKKARMHHHQSEFVSATRTPIPSNTVHLPPLPSQTSTEKTLSDWKDKASVLARITFPDGESAVSKKRKSGSSPAVNGSSHHRSHRMISNKYHEDHRKIAAVVSKNSYKYYADHNDYESGDDDRHFKRRPSRYESSSTPALKEGKHSNRGWREKGIMAESIGRLPVY